MSKVLVVYASRHGGTRGIAERICETLRADGLDAIVTSAGTARDVGVAEAFVIGSAVYIGSWLKEALEFVTSYESTLAGRPVWLFSSGPLKGSTAEQRGTGSLEDALGPADGPGSAGRKRVEALAAAIGAREHRMFYGAFDPSDPPRAMSERLVRIMPTAKGLLPPGDSRDWAAIETWAHEIAAALRSPVAVG